MTRTVHGSSAGLAFCLPANFLLTAGLLGFLFLAVPVALSQDAVRMSLASAQAAEARQKALTTAGYYNLKLGQTLFRFGANLGVQYQDNILLQEHNKESDVLFYPQLTGEIYHRLSEINSLSLGLGLGYQIYVKHTEFNQLNSISITPGSELAFDFYVGDFWFNLHDRITVSQNAYADPTATATQNYSRLENDAGLTTTWDLNKVIAKFGYDHINYISLTGESGGDGQSDVFSVSAGYTLTPGRLLGLEEGFSMINQNGGGNGSGTQWNSGAFYETRVSRHFSLSLHGGYTEYHPDSSDHGTNESFNGVYAQLVASHTLNRWMEYSLSGGRSITFAFSGGSYDIYTAALNVNWHILRKWTLGTGFDYQHGEELIEGGETFNRYGPQAILTRPLTQKLSTSLSYQFFRRDSDLPDRSYSANIITLNFSYRF
jgi:hypothetical protein